MLNPPKPLTHLVRASAPLGLLRLIFCLAKPSIAAYFGPVLAHRMPCRLYPACPQSHTFTRPPLTPAPPVPASSLVNHPPPCCSVHTPDKGWRPTSLLLPSLLPCPSQAWLRTWVLCLQCGWPCWLYPACLRSHHQSATHPKLPAATKQHKHTPILNTTPTTGHMHLYNCSANVHANMCHVYTSPTRLCITAFIQCSRIPSCLCPFAYRSYLQ